MCDTRIAKPKGESDMTLFPEETWQKGLAEIHARAARDPKFRQRCLDDAHGVIREVCGQEPPAEGPRVRFAERMDEQIVLLPPADRRSGELSERELGQVVAGVLANPQPAYGSICWASSLHGVS
jgi:hypothetical protein